MSGYLAGYGAGEERRAKIIKWALIGALVAVVGGTLGYFGLRHARERAQLDRLVEAVQRGDHAAGHALFGCTPEHPCRDYQMKRYLQDFGPQGEFVKLPEAKISEKWSCEGGIVRVYSFGPDKELELFVSSTDYLVSFAPTRRAWKGCTILP